MLDTDFSTFLTPASLPLGVAVVPGSAHNFMKIKNDLVRFPSCFVGGVHPGQEWREFYFTGHEAVTHRAESELS